MQLHHSSIRPCLFSACAIIKSSYDLCFRMNHSRIIANPLLLSCCSACLLLTSSFASPSNEVKKNESKKAFKRKNDKQQQQQNDPFAFSNLLLLPCCSFLPLGATAFCRHQQRPTPSDTTNSEDLLDNVTSNFQLQLNKGSPAIDEDEENRDSRDDDPADISNLLERTATFSNEENCNLLEKQSRSAIAAIADCREALRKRFHRTKRKVVAKSSLGAGTGDC